MDTTARYFVIVIVDIEKSGQRTNPDQALLRDRMYEAIDRAFNAAGIEVPYREDRGDGAVLLLHGSVPKRAVLGPFADALERELRQHARSRQAPGPLRLRAAVHAGEVAWDGRGWVGADLNTAFRLADMAPLRATLAAARNGVLALAVSDPLYQGVVRHDYPEIDSAAFLPVRFSAKEVRNETAWIRVPGYAEPPGITGLAPGGGAPEPDGREAAPGSPEDPRIALNYGIGVLHGGITRGGIGVLHGNVSQNWSGSDDGPEGPFDLRQELDSLRTLVKQALERRDIDQGTFEDASEELDEAERHADATDEEGRGRLLRALRKLKGLLEDVGGVADLVVRLFDLLKGAAS